MHKFWLIPIVLILAGCTTAPVQPVVQTGELATLSWPPVPAPPRIKFKAMFGSAEALGFRESFSQKVQKLLVGHDEPGMTRPYAIAVNAEFIVVADPGSSSLHVFNKQRKNYTVFHELGGVGFVSPVGVTFGDGNLYVADSALNNVLILGPRLKLKSVIGGFQRPTGIAYDESSNRLFVADTLAHEIRVFDRAGNFVTRIGERGEGPGQFNYPSHLAFSQDKLFVNDTMNFRIQIFDQEGFFIASLGEHGNTDGYLNQPKGLAVDPDGNVYIADAMSNHVQVFDQLGQFLLKFGHTGIDPGTFQLPAGLTFWENTLFVADSLNKRIQVFNYLPEGR